MISTIERNNFLRHCWRTGRWTEGVAMLLLPVRLPVYRFRKAAWRGYAGAGRVPQNAPADATPELSPAIHPPFCGRIPDAEAVDGIEELFADVKAQMGGEYRLAGGRLQCAAPASLGRLEDSEDHHAYHRLHWAARYSRAAAYGCEGAQAALARDFAAWLSTGWEGDPVFFWPYTVAERIASLAECLVWAPDMPVSAVKRQICQDAGRLADSVEYHLGAHNHLLNDARGLYAAAAAVPEHPQARDWSERAFQIWDEYFPKLVLEDGTFAEQSSHYHLLLCRTALEYWLGAQAFGRELPPGFPARLRRMFQLANDLLRPDGTIARFGDNSPDHTAGDLWGLLAAAWHYGLLEDAPRSQAVTPLTLYYCGSRPSLPRPRVPAKIRIYPEGGFAMLRSGDCELTAHGDPRPESAPHGDSGRGSFELWKRNQILIREPGSIWSSNPSERSYRTGKAQNVTCLNGVAPGITSEDRGYLPAWYATQNGSWDTPPEGGIRFRWNGFQRVLPDIACTRTWRFDGQGALIFEERIAGSSTVEFESRLCLGNAAWGPLGWDTAAGRGEMPHPLARMTIEAAPHTSAWIDECTYLEEYGVERSGRVLYLAGRPHLPLMWRLRWSFEGN